MSQALNQFGHRICGNCTGSYRQRVIGSQPLLLGPSQTAPTLMSEKKKFTAMLAPNHIIVQSKAA